VAQDEKFSVKARSFFASTPCPIEDEATVGGVAGVLQRTCVDARPPMGANFFISLYQQGFSSMHNAIRGVRAELFLNALIATIPGAAGSTTQGA
jgi:hypothetical protein